MIITVTLNPTLDKTLSVPRLEPGAVHRAQILRQDLGGKGINVSRALRAIGIDSRITGFIGGCTGQVMQSGLLATGFDVHFVEVEEETRQNITLLDEASGQYTKINEPGPGISPRHIAAFQAMVDQMARPADLWAFCGSLPPGAPSDLYARLIQQVQTQGGRAFLDTSGRAFRDGLPACPFAIKPNSEEAAEFLGLPVYGDDEHCAAARRLQSQGVELVALTRGAQGLVLAMDGEVLIATPPPVAARSPIGAGDAALAGLLWAVSDGCGPIETARRAVACGTAAAMQEGTGVGDRLLVEKLLDQVRVTRQSNITMFLAGSES
jgi:1-phosphofructokinase family hexose kinase